MSEQRGDYVVVSTAVEDFLDEKDQQVLSAGSNNNNNNNDDGGGDDDEDKAVPEPLEMELLASKYLVVLSNDKDWQQKVRHYVRRYPRATTLLTVVTVLFLGYVAYIRSRPPLQRNRLEHDYSDIDYEYFSQRPRKADYKCLFGDDDEYCDCEDFNNPVMRPNIHQSSAADEWWEWWTRLHESNKNRIDLNEQYGIVFLGDDLVENLNGMAQGEPFPQSKEINQYYRDMFTYENEDSNINSIALGISGDSTSNLLWRLENGELPEKMSVYVFWLMIGSSDLARGGCSEEATVLGILKVAETIHKAYPKSVIVIQGILPRTSRGDGLLEPRSLHTPLFGKFHSKKYKADMASNAFLLWPSIQSINRMLERFCELHEYMIYFDAGAFFLQEIQDPKIGRTHKIIKKYMPDYVHPSVEGWKKIGQGIHMEYLRIVLDEDEGNDIEQPDGND